MWAGSIRSVPVPIIAPFPNVTSHVIEAVIIGGEATNRRRVGVRPGGVKTTARADVIAVTTVAEVVRLTVCDCVSPRKSPAFPSPPCRILPLGFGREAIPVLAEVAFPRR